MGDRVRNVVFQLGLNETMVVFQGENDNRYFRRRTLYHQNPHSSVTSILSWSFYTMILPEAQKSNEEI